MSPWPHLNWITSNFRADIISFLSDICIHLYKAFFYAERSTRTVILISFTCAYSRRLDNNWDFCLKKYFFCCNSVLRPKQKAYFLCIFTRKSIKILFFKKMWIISDFPSEVNQNYLQLSPEDNCCLSTLSLLSKTMNFSLI